VSPETHGLDGTKLAGNAAHRASRTLPQIEKLLDEAAQVDAAEDAQHGGGAGPATPRALARRGERRVRLAAAAGRLAAGDKARRDAQRARQEAWDAAAARGTRRGGRRPGDEPGTSRSNTPPRADTTGPDERVMGNQKGYVCGCNGQLVVTAQQVIVGAMLRGRWPTGMALPSLGARDSPSAVTMHNKSACLGCARSVPMTERIAADEGIRGIQSRT
jgi:hypothetical protein